MNTHVKIITDNFLRKSPFWYKKAILLFLILNPILFFVINVHASVWMLLFEFVFCLALSLYCNPFLSGGLLSLEAFLIGMTKAENIHQQLINNQDVLLFLIFMITGVNVIKNFLLIIFNFLFLNIHSKNFLSILFFLMSAIFSAFFDALIVMVIIITAISQFYILCSSFIKEKNIEDTYIKKIRSYLRNLVMQSAIGSTIGGVMTISGEPQNMLIAKVMHWNFSEFFNIMSPITIPILFSGILTSIIVTYLKIFGYGNHLMKFDFHIILKKNKILLQKKNTEIAIHATVIFFVISSLVFQILDIVIIGFLFIILLTTFCGYYKENTLKKSSSEAFSFVFLLIIFFIISAVISEQKILHPLIQYLLKINSSALQFIYFYFFNGILSSISDNIFISSICMHEIEYAFNNEFIDFEKFKKLATITNIGTNIPSISTPNGQAAFLFILTSNVASLLNLTYQRMIIMAIPFTIVTTTVGLIFILLNI